MTEIKTKLRIQLFAGNQLVVESEDPQLWQRVLAAITADGASRDSAIGAAAEENGGSKPGLGESLDATHKMARELGVSHEQLAAACSPETEPPFIHMDHHYWEALKKNTPTRGPGSLPAGALAATLLALWFRNAGIGNVKLSFVGPVLATIGIRDPNLTRGLRNSEWLQVRGKEIHLNPAKFSVALGIARAFCTQSPVDK